jgi:hypothetical protein
MTDKEQDIEEIEKDEATEDAEVEKDENEDGFGEDE